MDTQGYAIVVTDEASSFFQEIKGQDVKHESNIGLLNQFFDGKGDKTSLAKLRQRFVPPNSTSMSLGVQPQPFFRALSHIGKTVWSERFCGALPFHYNKTLQVGLTSLLRPVTHGL